MAMRVESISAAEVSRGYQQVTGNAVTANFTLSPAVAISGQTPSVQYFRLAVLGAGTVRYRCDGVVPTATAGMPLLSGQVQVLAIPDLSKFNGIGSANTLEVNIEFFDEPS